MRRLLLITGACALGLTALAGCEPYRAPQPPTPYETQPPYVPPPPPPPPTYPSPPTRPGQTVSILACPARAVTQGCHVVRDQNGAVWDVTGVQPRPDFSRGQAVQITGRVADRASICMQGPIIEAARWEYSAVRCPS